MNKNVIGMIIIGCLVLVTMFVFQDPGEQGSDINRKVSFEELKKENEQLKQEIFDLEYFVELYESRYSNNEILLEVLTLAKEQTKEQMGEILKDIYESNLTETDLVNLHLYYELYETRYIKSYEAIQGFNRLFRMTPDPNLTAGEVFTITFSFIEEYEIYEGKEVAISAIQKDTKEMVSVLEPQLRKREHWKRLKTSVLLPVGGFWEFEITLDGEVYGTVEMFVFEP